jgi:hypothetical protein
VRQPDSHLILAGQIRPKHKVGLGKCASAVLLTSALACFWDKSTSVRRLLAAKYGIRGRRLFPANSEKLAFTLPPDRRRNSNFNWSPRLHLVDSPHLNLQSHFSLFLPSFLESETHQRRQLEGTSLYWWIQAEISHEDSFWPLALFLFANDR